MDRKEAIEKIKLLIGKDLVPLAEQYHVTIWKSPGKKIKVGLATLLNGTLVFR